MAKELTPSTVEAGTANQEMDMDSNENSPLCPTSSSSDAGESANAEMELWEEMVRPWPSTFERSISILASPMPTPQMVQNCTRSPKPGASHIAMARRSDLDRGCYTPQFGVDTWEETFQKGVVRVHSLDYSKTAESLDAAIDSVTAEQERKALKAKEYREQVLKKQGAPKAKPKARKAEIPAKGGKATFRECVFNFINILMGVGLLGLPYVFKKGGWLGGSMCLLAFSLSAWRTALLIGRELNGDPRPCHFFNDSPFKSPLRPGSGGNARMLPPVSSFPDIARNAFGEAGTIVISVILYFELFSCICVLMVAIGDHMHKLFPAISFNTHTTIVSLLSLVPTVLLRTPKLLAYFSMVGTIATVVLVSTVILSFLIEGDITEEVAAKEGLQGEGPFHVAWTPAGLPIALGMVSYCFSGHAIVPAIYTTMERPQEFESMVTLTFCIVITSCFSVAISGYIMFGTLVEEEVTLSLKENVHAETAMKALTWLMVLTGFSKVTLTMFPLALGLEELVAPYLTTDFMVNAASGVLKLILTVTALLVSLYFPSFAFLVAMVGILCTMAISIVFPAAAHLKLFGPKLSLLDKLMDWSFIIGGLAMTCIGTYAAFN